MRVQSLRIQNFRNLLPTVLEPGHFLNVFLGGNAQGKTSVLEALYFGCHLKSFRTKTYKDLIQFSENESQIEIGFENQNIAYHSVIRFGENRNKLLLNDKTVTKKNYSGKINAVAFSPDSLAAVKQGPEKRRELLDQAAALIFKEAADCQTQFEKTVRQKNACLKAMKMGEISQHQGRDIIESINQVLIPLSTDVIFLRTKIIDELSPKIENILKDITQKPVVFEMTQTTKGIPWTEKTYEAIKDRMEKEIGDSTNRIIEEQTARTLAGPHRQEIEFLLEGKEARTFCSQGQQRALILAFKIAEIVYHGEALGTQPLLLLDDVLSEFDEDKQRYLLDFLQKNEAQTFLTATHTSSLLRDAKVFHLRAGTVTTHGH